MPSYALTFLLFFFLSSSPAIAGKCNKYDKKILLTIKKEMNNPSITESWKPNKSCCKDWLGVVCANKTNRVFEIYIDDANTTFTVPQSISKLTFLTSLQLQNNPGLIGPIPPFIGDIKGLTFLRLDGNSLSGPIPNFFDKLSALEFLHLGSNKFSGTIPPSLGTLQAVDFIVLENNKLSGSIPAALAKTSATHLLLGHNMLSGTIPESFEHNEKLEIIDFSWNKLQGDATVLFGESKPTTYLDLSKNNFEFDLSKVRVPEGMRTLYLDHNKIYGGVTAELVNVASLNVSYNMLCGPIPVVREVDEFYNEFSFIHNKCLCGAPLPPCK